MVHHVGFHNGSKAVELEGVRHELTPSAVAR